jgi:hypothetical protein
VNYNVLEIASCRRQPLPFHGSDSQNMANKVLIFATNPNINTLFLGY